DHLVAYELDEAPRHRGAIARIAFLPKHRSAGHAVAGIDLRPSRLQVLPHRVDEPNALDLLGIAARRREHDDRPAEMAPADNRHIAFDPVGIPALSPLHGRTVSRIGADQRISWDR